MDSLACFFTNFDIILSLIWCYLGLDYKKKIQYIFYYCGRDDLDHSYGIMDPFSDWDNCGIHNLVLLLARGIWISFQRLSLLALIVYLSKTLCLKNKLLNLWKFKLWDSQEEYGKLIWLWEFVELLFIILKLSLCWSS